LWEIYSWFVVILLLLQTLFLYQSYRNYRYALNKSNRHNTVYHPNVLLTVPCKGLDREFDRNIASLLLQKYNQYRIHFVVEDTSDPAYESLRKIIEAHSARTQARDIQILIAGRCDGCSQKIHNLLYSCRCAPEDVRVFAFADSDACFPEDWLNELVYPLRKDKCGASTGYRWFVPRVDNLATLALSAINAKIAQQLGNTRFNHLWGGSMAVRADLFGPAEFERIWRRSISDDLGLSYAVKKAGRKVTFVPDCLVASYEQITWKALFEFARRQFLITRIITPSTWWFGLFSMVYSILGLWGGLAIFLIVFMCNQPIDRVLWAASIPAVFAGGSFWLAYLRQRMIVHLLPDDISGLRAAARADRWGTLVWSWLLLICILSSAFGNTITWRGIRYRILGPTETRILSIPK
jgi:cellulose synthase/poly-beta-1,6-N-acetylglucosamine synthase-like glycosyltransferase